MSLNAFDIPLEVTPIDGEVAITGPDGVAISLTREAAIASAERLLRALEQLAKPNADVEQT